MPLRTPHNRLDARNQFSAIKRLGQEIVGPETQPLQLVIQLGQSRKDQNRRAYARRAQSPQHFVAVDVRKHQIEDYDVVIIELADLEAVLAEIGRVANKVLLRQHHFDAGGGGRIVLDKKHAHKNLRVLPATDTGGPSLTRITGTS